MITASRIAQILTVVALLAGPIEPTLGQEVVVRGSVIEKGTNLPLPGASVEIVGQQIGDVTDTKGRFAIALNPGEYFLRVTHLGFSSETIPISTDRPEVGSISLTETHVDFPEVIVEHRSLTGAGEFLDRLPGSAHYIGPEELGTNKHTDIAKALKFIPGVNVRGEDGYGLRPNIGFRGTGSERSSKVTLMEDGILMAPAPYAAPAAYYFPSVGRMGGIEIRKGSSQVKYGPFTTGGAINFLATPIPATPTLHARANLSSQADQLLHVYGGSTVGRFGMLVEGLTDRATGFKKLDGNGPTGYAKTDVRVSGRYQISSATAATYQDVTVKAGYYDETSHETYLGLTEEDFRRDPLRRYVSSANDRMDATHTQLELTHLISPSNSFDVVTSLYHNTFSRNWYKLDKVVAGGASKSIGSVLEDPAENFEHYSLIVGQGASEGELLLKANNRDYYSRGLQATAKFNQDGWLVEGGLRLHSDGVDRFQWVDSYSLAGSELQLNSAGTPGTDSNRITTASAIAGHVQVEKSIGRLSIIAGSRLEDVAIRREDYGKTDPERLGSNLTVRRNHVRALIPGAGVVYQWSPAVHTFAGLHKGFAPPSSRDGALPEKSIDIEVGVRVFVPRGRFELVGFRNDYSNLLGVDLAAGGGSGSGDTFNGGSALAAGLEATAEYSFKVSEFTELPLRAMLTLTDAHFQSSFDSNIEAWGRVDRGDHLPYVSERQFSLSAGLDHQAQSFQVDAQYVGQMRTLSGQGPVDPAHSTDAYLLVDVTARYQLAPSVGVFGSVRNILDSRYVASRHPAGLRPGLPRRALLGIEVDL